jgi:hypothetical protein
MPNILLNPEQPSIGSSGLYSINYDYDYPDGLDFRPRSSLHKKIKDEILERALEARTTMSKRFPYWNSIDRTLTAYIELDSAEEKVLEGDSRKPVSIVLPYSYAVLETLLSYLVAAFVQDPIFRYEGVSPEDTIGAILMEMVIAQQCIKSKVGLNLHTNFRDQLAYGFGACGASWRQDWGYRITGQPDGYGGMEKVVEEAVLYEGNELINLDPYKCLPDPDVSIHEVQKMSYFGWCDQDNYYDLLAEESLDDNLFNVKYLKHLVGRRSFLFKENSARSDKVGGFSEPAKNTRLSQAVDIIKMYIKLIPKEWKLGTSTRPEKWYFELAADEVLLRAKPIGLAHDKFPVAVGSPDFDGYSPTPISRIETLYGMQGVIDWMFNAHVANVRKAVNDNIIVDPFLVNVNDFKTSKHGGIIRTRRPAWGKGVKDVAQQLGITDVTRAHIQDVAFVIDYMQKIGGVDDAAMGILRQGGPERLTTAEYQGTRSGAVSRLRRVATVVGLQFMQDVGEFFGYHAQQMMTEDTYVKAVGEWQERLIREYAITPGSKMKVTPFDLLIGFDVIVRDGSIPGDNYSEVWEKLFDTIAQNPGLQQRIDLFQIFSHIARNNGAKNVDEFKVKVMPNEQVDQQVQQGNVIPFNPQQTGGQGVGV